MHYFGTQEFAWMKGKDVVSFGQGLQRGMHLCKASNRSKAAFQRALHEASVYFLVGDVHRQTLPASAAMTINIVFGLHYPMLNIESFDLWAQHDCICLALWYLVTVCACLLQAFAHHNFLGCINVINLHSCCLGCIDIFIITFSLMILRHGLNRQLVSTD